MHQASAGFAQLFIAGVNSFGQSTHIRAISLALDYAQLNDPQLQAELQLFDRDCYLRALAKLESGTPLQGRRPPEWRGDEFWFDTPGFYDDLEAENRIDSWASRYDFDTEFGPHCNEWWRDADLGLESRLYSYIERTTSIGSSKTDIDGVGNLLQIDPKEKTRAVRAFLKKSPPDILGNMTGGDSAPGNKGNPIAPSSWLGKAGILIGYAIAKTATFIITIGLPMVQAIVLACVYIALPIAVPFATLRPGLLVFFISALFSLKFLTALWALSKFIDERMIDYMYGDTGILVQWGFNDMVLTIITSLSYVGLPIVWLWLMSSFTGKGVEGVNLLFAYSAAKLDSAAQQSAGIVQSTAQSTAMSKLNKKDDD